MRRSIILTAAAMLPLISAASDNSDVDISVCHPEVGDSGAVPPCVQIDIIENACMPNGSDPIDYQAHAQCMCNGSYFPDWYGCQNCLLVHGFRSERDNAYWSNVMSAASDALCTGTPTAALNSLFASAQTNTNIPYVTTGNSKTSDQFPDKTAVSLYYTATVSQGPGRITGDALSATRDETETSTAPSTSPTGDDNDDDGDDGDGDGEEAEESTTTSPNVAAPTQGPGIVMAMAAAALVAAL